MINKILTFLVLSLSACITAYAANPAVISLLTNATTTQTSTGVNFFPNNYYRTHQVTLSGTSAVSASGTIQGSNDGSQWLTITTFNLTSAVPSAASTVNTTFAIERVVVSAISSVVAGSAVLNVTVGE